MFHFSKHYVGYLGKEWTPLSQWWAVSHLGEEGTVLQLGSVGALSHLLQDRAVGPLALGEWASLAVSLLFTDRARKLLRQVGALGPLQKVAGY